MPESSPVLTISPRSAIACTSPGYSAVAKSRTLCPCCAQSKATAQPPLPAPSTATSTSSLRITEPETDSIVTAHGARVVGLRR